VSNRAILRGFLQPPRTSPLPARINGVTNCAGKPRKRAQLCVKLAALIHFFWLAMNAIPGENKLRAKRVVVVSEVRVTTNDL